MGYYTSFALVVEKPADVLLETRLIEALGEEFKDVYTDGGHVRAGVHTKWYSFEEDMRALSLEYPGLLFTLDGEGEEPGDLWRCYIKDGKSQMCAAEITYPPYDPEKMTGD